MLEITQSRHICVQTSVTSPPTVKHTHLFLFSILWGISENCKGKTDFLLPSPTKPTSLFFIHLKRFLLLLLQVFTWFCFSCDQTPNEYETCLMTVISEGKIRLQWTECTVLVLSIVDCVGFVYVCVVREAYGKEAPKKRYCMNRDYSVNATPCCHNTGMWWTCKGFLIDTQWIWQHLKTF